MIKNIYNMLAPGGSFICISRGNPETRMGFLQNKQLKWTIEILKIQKAAVSQNKETFDRIDTEPFYYVYVCVKSFWF